MKKLVLSLILSFAAFGFAMAQYPHKWSLGGSMGLGAAMYSKEEGAGIMSVTMGFNRVVPNTRWRWGIDLGIMNQGLVDDNMQDKSPDRFLRPNYEYIGPVADYCLLSKGEDLALFVRGGVAPAHRTDQYIAYFKDKFTVLGQLALGLDFPLKTCRFKIPQRLMVSGYFDPRGVYVINFSYGWWFGKRNKD